MSVEQNKEIFRRWIEEGWNRGDLSVVDGLYAPAYVSHSFPPNFPPDREGLKQFVSNVRGTWTHITTVSRFYEFSNDREDRFRAILLLVKQNASNDERQRCTSVRAHVRN